MARSALRTWTSGTKMTGDRPSPSAASTSTGRVDRKSTETLPDRGGSPEFNSRTTSSKEGGISRAWLWTGRGRDASAFHSRSGCRLMFESSAASAAERGTARGLTRLIAVPQHTGLLPFYLRDQVDFPGSGEEASELRRVSSQRFARACQGQSS